ncbi:MAG: hypothetical protein IPL26_19730 [Leptospiraceae bacterium]|nr:hypothetical protein [Leptospiraceae bacterium]
MRNRLSELAINTLTALVMISVIAFFAVNIYHTYSTMRFHQKMILVLEHKCGWYIDDTEDKNE